MDFDKVIERIENMLFEVCGCNLIEGEIALRECLFKIKNNPNYERDLNLFKKHIKLLREYSQNNPKDEAVIFLKDLIDSQIIKADKFLSQKNAEQVNLSREQVDYIKNISRKCPH